MRQLTLTILLVLAAIHPAARANLWETKTQIEVRWGEPIKITGYPNDRIYTYQFGQLEVRVGFLDGCSQFEQYQHRDEKSPLSKSEVEQSLQSNASGKEWRLNGDRYEFPDKSVRADTYADSSGVRSIDFETEQHFGKWRLKEPPTRTGKEEIISGSIKLRQVDQVQWIVLQSGANVLVVPWSAPGYKSPAELMAGHTYTFILLDQESIDIYTRIACLSDREHKDWKDTVYDSKVYLLDRILDGGKVVFDRSICEVHHVQMLTEQLEISYGMACTKRVRPSLPSSSRLHPWRLRGRATENG